MGNPVAGVDVRAEQDRIEEMWRARLEPHIGSTVRVRCRCRAIVDELEPAGWSLVSAPHGRPHRGNRDAKVFPGVTKTVTAGKPPGYLLVITYKHRTARCMTVSTIPGEELAQAFIDAVSRGDREIAL